MVHEKSTARNVEVLHQDIGHFVPRLKKISFYFYDIGKTNNKQANKRSADHKSTFIPTLVHYHSIPGRGKSHGFKRRAYRQGGEIEATQKPINRLGQPTIIDLLLLYLLVCSG